MTIYNGNINNTPIGQSEPSTASFTDVNVSGTLTNFTGSLVPNNLNQAFSDNYIGLIVTTSDILNYYPNINNIISIELSNKSKSPNVLELFQKNIVIHK